MKIFTTSLLTIAMAFVCLGQTAPTLRWFKGNTHTHTKNSDGDSPPDVAVRWYADHKYNFLFITDHEFVTPVEDLNSQFGREGEFAVFRGQEVTDRVNNKPYHINALGIDRVTMPKKGPIVIESIQTNIDAVRSIGGVPQLNHPNFGWALTADEIFQLKNIKLMEIHNGHPLVNNLGGGGVPGAEEIWDILLSRGMLIYGIADDDVHTFIKLGDRSQPNPGQGWIVVRAASLTPEAILAAMEKGDFYASTGPELADYQVDSKSITINIRPKSSSKYTTQFIGQNGKILKTDIANPAIYKFTGKEKYVRAKIIESNATYAWTQPVILKK